MQLYTETSITMQTKPSPQSHSFRLISPVIAQSDLANAKKMAVMLAQSSTFHGDAQGDILRALDIGLEYFIHSLFVPDTDAANPTTGDVVMAEASTLQSYDQVVVLAQSQEPAPDIADVIEYLSR